MFFRILQDRIRLDAARQVPPLLLNVSRAPASFNSPATFLAQAAVSSTPSSSSASLLQPAPTWRTRLDSPAPGRPRSRSRTGIVFSAVIFRLNVQILRSWAVDDVAQRLMALTLARLNHQLSRRLRRRRPGRRRRDLLRPAFLGPRRPPRLCSRPR
jgi:hypothetical protein